MSWTFNDLKYGWKIAAGITLATTTIFVVDNQRQRINQADVIEIVLGTVERCLATQYSTNPVAYHVSPPEFVRDWQDTNGIVTVTNTIGWRIDKGMLADLDTRIKSLVPYYMDTNTLYFGSSNIAMHTVTGLWASLEIGDGTNQFTSYGWRITTNALTERYKVLEALKVTEADLQVYTKSSNAKSVTKFAGTWGEAKSLVDGVWATNALTTVSVWPLMSSAGSPPDPGGGGAYYAYADVYNYWADIKAISTNLSKAVGLYVRAQSPTWPPGVYENPEFDGFGHPVADNGWSEWAEPVDVELAAGWVVTNILIGDESFTQPGWCREPTGSSFDRTEIKGWEVRDYKAIQRWGFHYATNKFW